MRHEIFKVCRRWRALHSTIQILQAQKNRGEKIHSPPGLKLLIGTTKELRSRYRDIGKLVFLFLRGRLFLGGLLSFFLSCHID
jgi:hypothetical protein